MANIHWIGTLLIGFVVGVLFGVVILALLQANKETRNLCPRCKNETEEEKQLKQDWAEQQKGYK